jgi:D-alanyl-D-alanine carboxypeptidase
MAFDVCQANSNCDLVQSFGDTPTGKWVAEHAHEYGFVVRYLKGKEAITGYEYEPWHLRYVGVDLATQLYKNKLTLEEYLLK